MPGVDDADLDAAARREAADAGRVPALGRVHVGVIGVVEPVELAEARVVGRRERAQLEVRLGVLDRRRAAQRRRGRLRVPGHLDDLRAGRRDRADALASTPARCVDRGCASAPALYLTITLSALAVAGTARSAATPSVAEMALCMGLCLPLRIHARVPLPRARVWELATPLAHGNLRSGTARCRPAVPVELSFCVVNTEQRGLLRYCLDAIARERATVDFETEVLVLDNASQDGSVDVARGHPVGAEVIALPAAAREVRERLGAAAAGARALLPAAQRGLRARAGRDRRAARRARPPTSARARRARCSCAPTASSSRRRGASPRPARR